MLENFTTGNLFLFLLVMLSIGAWFYIYRDILSPDKEAMRLLELSKHCWPGVKDEDLEFKKIKKRLVLARWLGISIFSVYGLLIVITLVLRILGI